MVRLAEVQQQLLQESAACCVPNPASEAGGDAVVFKLANRGQPRRSWELRVSSCALCTVHCAARLLIMVYYLQAAPYHSRSTACDAETCGLAAVAADIKRALGEAVPVQPWQS